MVGVRFTGSNRQIRDRVSLSVKDALEGRAVTTGISNGSEVLDATHVNVLCHLELGGPHIVARGNVIREGRQLHEILGRVDQIVPILLGERHLGPNGSEHTQQCRQSKSKSVFHNLSLFLIGFI